MASIIRTTYEESDAFARRSVRQKPNDPIGALETVAADDSHIRPDSEVAERVGQALLLRECGPSLRLDHKKVVIAPFVRRTARP
jgi:hypothetical protein